MAENLLIVGASARAAAFSALRAGLQPWCADLFADADLVARCRETRVEAAKYPQAFAEIATWKPLCPWMYAGGLENHPQLVATISQRRRLWGTIPGAVRDPVFLAWRLAPAGPPLPRAQLRPPDEADATRWLVKPLAGAGGREVHFWKAGARERQHVCYQEFIPGPSCAAIFLGQANAATMLGVTTQLVGLDWLHAASFSYCGSISGRRLETGAEKMLQRFGNIMVGTFGLRGLFGVDCILRDGVPYPVEVNPRYTASVEVLEYASQTSLLAQHRAVFDAPSQPLAFRARPALSEPVGKAILFAKDDLTFPSDGPWMSTLRHPGDIWEMPAFADIPQPGEPIEKGKPILTFFARGPTEAGVLATLQATAADLERWLFKS